AADLLEQDHEAVLFRAAEVRALALGLERQITDLSAVVRGEAIPVLPPLRREPDDRRQDLAPRDLPCRGECLQYPSRHSGLPSTSCEPRPGARTTPRRRGCCDRLVCWRRGHRAST